MSTTKRPEDAKTIVGIKAVPSKKNDTVWYTYFCTCPFSDYEVENSKVLSGVSVESVSVANDLGLKIGDVVDFVYGRAIGTYQPIKGVNILSTTSEIKK